jgi:hypothetical protein
MTLYIEVAEVKVQTLEQRVLRSQAPGG